MPTTRIYHGDIHPSDIARDLIAHYNRGAYQVQQIGRDPQIAIQIATRHQAPSGGQTALTITIHRIGDGVSVQVGKQALIGVAASLGVTALSALRNPFSLIGRLDDIAQDIESLQLNEEVWQVIERTIRQFGVGKDLSDRLKRYACPYCNTANPPGEGRCIACGAPLGDIQPRTCMNCGFVVNTLERICPNCHNALPQS
ncbi:MAG: zinc ribbon domain-containing protein [Brevefilum sp.]